MCQVLNGGKMEKESRILLKPHEVSDRLGIGRSRTYEMLTTGELPSIRIGKSIRVPVDALRKWVEDKEVNATDDHENS